ncbi:MAG: UPF0182 family membrane protein [Actinomycetota bacterium]
MAQRINVRRGSRWRGALIAILTVGFFSISTVVAFYTDLLWFEEVGFKQVFTKVFATKLLVAGIFGLAFFVFTLANLLVVGRLMPDRHILASVEDPLQRYRQLMLPYFRWISIGGSAFLALVFAGGLAPQWDRFLLFTNATNFGRTDPVFGRDIGFFVFRLPMLQVAYGWIFSSLVIITLVTAGAHYLTGGIRPQATVGRVTPQVKAHLSVLIGLIALVRAWGYRLDQFQLLYSTRGDVTGASYTDINAELPALKLLVIISIIGAILFLVNIRFKGWALPLTAVGLWFLVSVLAAGVFPFVIQRLRVEPAQIQKERKFIQKNIQATRTAYALDGIDVKEYPAKTEVTKQQFDENPQTIDNIRLFDPELLKTAYRSLEEFQTYYEFNDVDVDRYRIGGQQRQVMISARELDLTNLETAAWVTNKISFTHGYGVVVSPTNEAGPEGQPKFLAQGIPSRSDSPALKIKQGGIYYGERIFDYSLVRTKEQELDYDEQSGKRYTRYAGKGGVALKNPVRRAALAWRFRNVNLAISGLAQPDTKILFRRRIKERLTAAAPFLSFDGDPYPVITDGRIVWMVDAYTTSNMYPYSERLDFSSRTQATDGSVSFAGTNNYIRNSVKATVDAYDGSIKFYVWDKKDPIIQAWRKAFPVLFNDAGDMPPSLREHIRYPEDLFRIQSFTYARYHLTDPVDFFTRKNLWVIPKDASRQKLGDLSDVTPANQGEEVQPYYVQMKLPGAKSENFSLILPMNPKGKPNMVAYLAANSDPATYGEITDFRFPKTKTIFGVGQIHARINADPAFSRERTLLGTAGSNLQFGDLLVIPLGDAILYVQPIFLQADNNAIPELKFVALASGEKVVLGKSLPEAIQRLVGNAAPGTPVQPPDGAAPTPQPGSSASSLAAQALDHLTKADAAARAGDWATYGNELAAAKQALQGAAPEATPTPTPAATPTTKPA